MGQSLGLPHNPPQPEHAGFSHCPPLQRPARDEDTGAGWGQAVARSRGEDEAWCWPLEIRDGHKRTHLLLAWGTRPGWLVRERGALWTATLSWPHW